MAQILTQVRLSTLENINLSTVLLSGVSKIDGVAVSHGDRILVKAQTNRVENGIYSLGQYLTVTNFISTGVVSTKCTVSSTTGFSVGDTFIISGATGTQQSKLNGSWVISSIVNSTQFTFNVSSALTTGTYTSGIGTTLKTNGVLNRASDFAAGSIQTGSTVVFVQEGNTLADTGWLISTDGSINVGTDAVEFEKFSNNLKLSGYDVTSSIVLRSEKGYPLTIDELDNNFKYLATTLDTKLNSSDFNALNIVDRINSLSAAQASLDAWELRGYSPNSSLSENTIVLRDEVGDVYSNNFVGDLLGNASTADLADYATLANNVDGVVAVLNGGTGATDASGARANLGAVNIAGDNMTGKLILAQANASRSSLNIPPKAADVNNPVNGDIWTSTTHIQYRLNGVTQSAAPINSPVFTGAPQAPTAEISSNSNALATTEYVQLHRAQINDALYLKAPLLSPTLTGTPNSTTPATNDNSTRIATTAFTVARINSALGPYYTADQVNSAISGALINYYTKAQTDNRISVELGNYYTKAQVDDKLTDYYTKAQTDNRITNAIASKANTTYVDGLQDKWGSSRKFVQSTAPSGAVNGDFWFKV